MSTMRVAAPGEIRLSPRLLAAVALAHGGLLGALLVAPDQPAPVTLARPLAMSLIDAVQDAPQEPAPESAPEPVPEPQPAQKPQPAPPREAAPMLAAERPLAVADTPQQATEVAEPTSEPVAEPMPAASVAATAPVAAPAAPRVPPRPADYRSNPKPTYPPLSRRLGEAGTVHLDILVNPDGSVAQLVLARSSGYPRLDRSAIETVQSSWKFEPAREGGKPVAAWVTVPIQFTLRS